MLLFSLFPGTLRAEAPDAIQFSSELSKSSFHHLPGSQVAPESQVGILPASSLPTLKSSSCDFLGFHVGSAHGSGLQVLGALGDSLGGKVPQPARLTPKPHSAAVCGTMPVYPHPWLL